MEVTAMTLILERTAIIPVMIPQVSAIEGTHPQDPSQTISPSLGPLTPLVAKSTSLPQAFSSAIVLNSAEKGLWEGNPTQ